MSCNICFETFDEEERRPKILKCGHTFCLECLLQLCNSAAIQCPEDRTVVRVSDPRQLPDNYSLQSLIAQCRHSAPRFFCLDCDGDASSRCMENHIISSLKRVRLQRVKDRLSSVKEGCGAAILLNLIRQLDLVKKKSCHPELDAQQAYLADKHSKVKKALGSFYKALDIPGTEWEDALKVLEEESKALAPKLSTFEDSLEILNINEPKIRVICGRRGGTWSGRLQVSDGELNLFRGLLFRQRMHGNLARAQLGEAGPREKILWLLQDEAFPTCRAEEVLDMSHFHDTYGFENNSEELQQLLESKEKVRVLRGLGAYDKTKASSDELQIQQSVHQSISMALSRHSDSAEVVYLLTGCEAHLRTALSIPNLRKLDVSYADWRCSQCSDGSAEAGVSRSSVQIAVLDIPKEWMDVVEQYGKASLREIVIRKAFVPGPGKSEVDVPDSFGLSCYSSLQSITLLRADL